MKKQVYIGCSGWSYKHWLGKYYPKKLESKKWLEFYINDFKSVEVNMTYYRFPSPNVIKSWFKRTPDDFRFTFKGNKLITHTKKLKETKDLVTRFQDLIDLMGNKLGCVLWQLPPSLYYSEGYLDLLDDFLSSLKKENNNVIEFRHESWWNKETQKLLKKHNAVFCSVSAPSLPDDFVVIDDIGYIRFHGADEWYSYKYSKKELEDWAGKINSQETCKTIYCYFNNDYMAYALKDAKELMEILK